MFSLVGRETAFCGIRAEVKCRRIKYQVPTGNYTTYMYSMDDTSGDPVYSLTSRLLNYMYVVDIYH